MCKAAKAPVSISMCKQYTKQACWLATYRIQLICNYKILIIQQSIPYFELSYGIIKNLIPIVDFLTYKYSIAR